MRGFGVASALAAAGLISSAVAQNSNSSSSSSDIDTIEIVGSKFFYSGNGSQFFIRGVAYQQDYQGGNGTNAAANSDSNSDYTDPLADASSCKRDIQYLQMLRTNTIRVYAIDPTQNHDECMNALADAGIYVIADLSAPVEGQSINRDSPSWNVELYQRYTSVVDALAPYPNTLGFFAGNEVTNAPNNTNCAAFVKAAVRDTKAYIKNSNYRSIGVGYATDDDPAVRVNIADYLNCDSQEESVDFWGYNIYSWCGDSDFQTSGYADRTEQFSTYSVPAFFAEYGCNDPSPREFTEVQALFGDNMTDVWSGGIVYMYFEEDNNFGLVSIDGDSVSTLDDFNNLSTQMASANPTGVMSASYTPSNSLAACPTTDSTWVAVATTLPGTPSDDLCSCMYNSLACKPADSVDSSDYGDFFGTLCGLDGSPCDGITANASTGTYGPYSGCNATEQLGYALNAYYSDTGDSAASACDFSGSATLVSAATPTGSCSSLLANSAAATSDAGSSGKSGSSGSKNTGKPSSSTGAAAPITVAGGASGVWPVVVVGAVGVLSGMGMVLL